MPTRHGTFQKWSPIRKTLEIDEGRIPLKTETVITTLEKLKGLATNEVISAFFSSRPLTPNMQGNMVVLMLDVSFRKQQAHQFYELLEELRASRSSKCAVSSYAKRDSRDRRRSRSSPNWCDEAASATEHLKLLLH